MDRYDLYWLLDLNEAIDVWADTNDKEARPPVAGSTTGTANVRIKGL